jgi:outer membrane lipoprotein carrier protein
MVAKADPRNRPPGNSVGGFLLKFLVLLLLSALCCSAAAASAPDVHAIAKAVDDRYNHLRSLETEFSETYRGMGVERAEAGTLWLKKPGRMRWEYRTPQAKLFVSDGKNAWFYLPGERQARRIPVKQLDDLRSPLAFLLGKARLEKELEGLSFAPDVKPATPGDIVLRGVPKMLAERVNQVIVEVTPESRIARIILQEADGSETEFRFSEQKENVTVAEERFHFEPPPGVEVVEGEMGQ